MKLIDLALVLLIDLIWGLTFIAGKIGVLEMPPVLFTGLRFVMLAIALVPMLRIVPTQMRRILLISVFCGALHFALMYSALKLADDISTIAVVTQLTLPFSVILAMVMLRERVSPLRFAGIVAAFSGVVVIGFDPRVFGYGAAVVLVVLASLSMAFAQVLMRDLKNVNTFTLQAWVALVSAPSLIGLSFVMETGQVAAVTGASLKAWAALTYAAVGSSLIGFGGMYYLLKRYPVTLVTPLFLLAPIFAVIAGVMLMGDVLTVRVLIGAAITLGGVLVITLTPTPKAA